MAKVTFDDELDATMREMCIRDRLMPTTNKWSSFLQAIDMFSDDFMATGRDDNLEQEREKL